MPDGLPLHVLTSHGSTDGVQCPPARAAAWTDAWFQLVVGKAGHEAGQLSGVRREQGRSRPRAGHQVEAARVDDDRPVACEGVARHRS